MALEAYESDGATVYILHTSRKLSTGFLKLKPKVEFQKHVRPVIEQLTQVQGKCVINLMKDDKVIKEISMKEGTTIKIPANQYHTHSNPFDEVSITIWRFEGDITKIIKGIRENFKRVI